MRAQYIALFSNNGVILSAGGGGGVKKGQKTECALYGRGGHTLCTTTTWGRVVGELHSV